MKRRRRSLYTPEPSPNPDALHSNNIRSFNTHPTTVPRAAGRPAKMPDAGVAPHRGGADPAGGARRPGIALIRHGFWLSG